MANKTYEQIVEEYANTLPKGLLKVNEVTQRTLLLKSVATKYYEQATEECHTFRVDDKFGFNERLVNQLMEVAYNLGAQSIDYTSYQKGYDACWANVLEKLGVEEDED